MEQENNEKERKIVSIFLSSFKNRLLNVADGHKEKKWQNSFTRFLLKAFVVLFIITIIGVVYLAWKGADANEFLRKKMTAVTLMGKCEEVDLGLRYGDFTKLEKIAKDSLLITDYEKRRKRYKDIFTVDFNKSPFPPVHPNVLMVQGGKMQDCMEKLAMYRKYRTRVVQNKVSSAKDSIEAGLIERKEFIDIYREDIGRILQYIENLKKREGL